MKRLSKNTTVAHLFAAACLVLAVPTDARAVAYAWNNAAGGAWNTATNWTPNGVPNSTADTATIALPGTYTVALPVGAPMTVGQLALGAGTGTQTLDIGTNATLALNAGTAQTSTVGAGGVLSISGGALLFQNSHAMTVNGGLSFSAGQISFPILTLSSTAVMDLSGPGLKNFTQQTGFDVVSNGTINWSGNGTLELNYFGGTFTNAGSLFVSGDPTISLIRAPFINTGTMTKNGGTGLLMVSNVINGLFLNNGTVNVLTGGLHLDPTVAGLTVMSNGAGNAFNAGPGTTIRYDESAGSSVFAGTTFAGAGQHLFSQPVTNAFNGTINATTPNLNVSAGQINGPFTLNGTLNWSGGTLSPNNGDITVGAGSTLNLSGAATKGITCCAGPDRLVNAGVINWSGTGTFNFATFAAFVNQAGAQFNINSAAQLSLVNAAFTNAGVITKLPASGTTTMPGFGVTLANSGAVTLNGQLIDMQNDTNYAQTAGTTSLGTGGGGFLIATTAPANISGGTFTGIGTVGTRLDVSGTANIGPGNSPGQLFLGGYSQSGGTLAMELNGTTPGTGYDQLVVAGTVALGGTLNLTMGFTPVLGTVFTLIDNDLTDAVTGTFTGLPEGASVVVGAVTMTISYLGGTGNDVTLTVTAVALPGFTLLPAVLPSFGSVNVGSASGSQTATLTNTSTFLPLLVTSISVSGPFTFATTCPASLGSGANCPINVQFAPIVGGNGQAGTLTVVTNAGTLSVSLSGDGVATAAPNLTLAPSALDFGTQPVGTTSLLQSVMVGNSGSAPLDVTGIAATAPFSVLPASGAGSCPAAPFTLAPGASCIVDVVFSPATAGRSSGTLSVASSNAPMATLPLTGTGGAGKRIAVTPDSLDFGGVTLDTPSAPLTFGVANIGSEPVTVSSIVLSSGAADFTLTHNCVVLNAPAAGSGDKCNGVLVFQPRGVGARAGVLGIASDAIGSPEQLSLKGIGLLQPFPLLTTSVTHAGFGQRAIANRSAAQIIRVTNSGEVPVDITAITTTGDFHSTHNCPATLPSAQACLVTAWFIPALADLRTGALLITNSGRSNPLRVNFQGTGCRFNARADVQSFVAACAP